MNQLKKTLAELQQYSTAILSWQSIQQLNFAPFVSVPPTLSFKWIRPGVFNTSSYVSTSYDSALKELLSLNIHPAGAASVPVPIVQSVWLQGITGSGKTSLAQAYLAKFLAENPESHYGFVLMADNFKNFQASLRALAEALVGVSELKAYLEGLSDEEKAAALTQVICHGLSQKLWVLIIDNVEEEIKEIWECLKQLNMPSAGQVLFTSQHPSFMPAIDTMDLSSGLKQEDARQVLNGILSEVTAQIALGSEDDLNELIATLNGLPLALSLAGYYLRQSNLAAARLQSEARVSYRSYQQLLTENIRHLEDEHSKILTGHPFISRDNVHLIKTQEAATRLSVKKAIGLTEGQKPNAILWRLLCFCGFLPSDGIPQILLTNYLKELDSASSLDELIEKAQAYSLVQISSVKSTIDDKPSLHLHRVVQQLLREEFWPALRQQQEENATAAAQWSWLSTLSSLFFTQSLSRPSTTSQELNYQREGLAKVVNRLIEQRSFKACEAWIEMMESYLQFTRGLTILDHSQQTILWQGRCCSSLAAGYRFIDQYTRAKDYGEQARGYLACYYETEEHIELTSTLDNLATVIGALGDVTQKKELLEKVLRIQVAHYRTEEHIEVARTLHNLAQALGDLGDVTQEKTVLEKVLRIQVAHYRTEEHIEVVGTLHNLAIALGTLGDVTQMKTLLEKVLRIQVAHYRTEEHIDVARTLHNLAIVLGDLGDVAQEKTLLEKVLRIQVAHYCTEEHIEVARTLANLAHALGALGDVAQEKTVLEKVLRIQVAHYCTEEHIEVAQVLRNLAIVLGVLGDENQKKTLLEKVLRIQVAHYRTEEHIDVARTLHNLANVFGDLGDVTQMKTLLEKVLRIQVAHYRTEEHIEVARTLHNLAHALGALGDENQKKILLEKVLRIQVAHYRTEDHIEVARTLHNLANVLGDLGDVTQMKTLLEKVLRIEVAHYRTEEHIDVARTLHNLAIVLGDLGDENQKKTLLEKVLRIQVAHYRTEEHIDVARTLHNLANVLGDLGDENQKKTLLEKVLRIQLDHYHTKINRETANTYFNLAYVHQRLNQLSAAAECMSKAYDGYKAQLGAEHHETQDAYRRWQQLKERAKEVSAVDSSTTVDFLTETGLFTSARPETQTSGEDSKEATLKMANTR